MKVIELVPSVAGRAIVPVKDIRPPWKLSDQARRDIEQIEANHRRAMAFMMANPHLFLVD